MTGEPPAARADEAAPLAMPTSRLPAWLRPLRDAYSVLRWHLRGRPVPPPPSWKQRLVRRHGRRFGLVALYESGTARGDMVAACRRSFRRIHSIELDPGLHQAARRRFAGQGRVRLHLGDSAEVLPRLLEEEREPCLFWLDGRAMVGGPSGALATPIRAELAAILAHPEEGHVVLVDDARLLTGRGDYPRLGEIEDTIRAARPGWCVEVRHDVLRAHRAPPEPASGRLSRRSRLPGWRRRTGRPIRRSRPSAPSPPA